MAENFYRYLWSSKDRHKKKAYPEEEAFRLAKTFKAPFISISKYFTPPTNDDAPHIAELWIDIDTKDSRADAIKLCELLENKYRLKPTSYQIQFSGRKGFHIFIPPEVFGDYEISITKKIAEKLSQEAEVKIDTKIYSTGHISLYKHRDTGLYKNAFTLIELKKVDLKTIRKVCKQPKKTLSFKPEQNPFLANLVGECANEYQKEKQIQARPKPTRKTAIPFDIPDKEKLLYEILNRVDQVKKVRDVYNFRCPLHSPDKNPSAYLYADNLVFNCYGCLDKAIGVKEFLEKAGWYDLLEDYIPKPKIKPKKEKIASDEKEILDKIDKLLKDKYSSFCKPHIDYDLPIWAIAGLALAMKRKEQWDSSSDDLYNFKLFCGVIDDSTIKKPICYPAKCGTGKTLFLKHIAQFMFKERLPMGIIIVMERQKDILDFAEELNSPNNIEKGIYSPFLDIKHLEKETHKLYKSLGDKIAYPFIGYSEELCLAKIKPTQYYAGMCKRCYKDNCHIKYGFQEQRDYPIVIITHKRLSDVGIDNLLEWEHGKRELFFIDEKPPFFKFYEGIKIGHIRELIETLKLARYSWRSKIFKLALHVMDSLKEIEKNAERCRENKISWIKPKTNLIIAGSTEKAIYSALDLKDSTNESLEGKDLPETLQALCAFSRNGGMIEADAFGSKLHTYKYRVQFTKKPIKTIIMDGTSFYDPEYKNPDFVYSVLKEHLEEESDKGKDYENLQININRDRNLTKTAMERPEVLQRVAQEIVALANKYPSDNFYIITSKELESDLASPVKEHLPNTVIIESPVEDLDLDKMEKQVLIFQHYNNTKGDNNMRYCSRVVFASNYKMPEPHTYLKTKALTGKEYEDITIGADSTGRAKRTFADSNVEFTAVMDWSVTFIQEVYRTKLRLHTNDPVYVYCWSKDRGFHEVIKRYFEGARIDLEWKSEVFTPLSKEVRHIIDVIRKAFSEGQKFITKKEVREITKIPDSSFRRFLSNYGQIIEAEAECRIENKGFRHHSNNE